MNDYHEKSKQNFIRYILLWIKTEIDLNLGSKVVEMNQFEVVE